MIKEELIVIIEEIWIENNGYRISNYGKVTKKNSDKLQKMNTNEFGYVMCSVKFKDGFYARSVHRAVAYAFLGDTYRKGLEVNHIDGNKENNRVDNLEWSTLKEQMQHAYSNNLKEPVQGILQGNSVLTEKEVKEIREIYKSHSKEFGMIALAKKYNVSVSTINKCVGRRSYKNVK